MLGTKQSVYTVQGMNGYASIDFGKAKFKASERSIKEEITVAIYKDGKFFEKVGREIYKIKGTETKSFNFLELLVKAKQMAVETKSVIQLMLNGNPYKSINWKGSVKAA